MRIVQITHYMPPHLGGIERVADALFEAYRNAGFDVEWVASRVPRDAPDEPGRHRVSCLNVLETAFGIPVPVWGVSAIRALAASIGRADVVHAHDCLYPGSALAVHLARRSGLPALLTQHVGFVPYRSRALNTLERAAYTTMGRTVLRTATRIVLATPAAEAHVRELLRGLPTTAAVIPNGMDLDRFTVVEEWARHRARIGLALPVDGPVVLFVGRLVDKKGVPFVLDVARRLPETRFLVLGDGPVSVLMQNAPSNVSWTRKVRPTDMTRYYHASDCLLLPSRGEGLPLVVQEALACGLSAVVCDDEPYALALAAAGLVEAVPRDVEALTAATRTASLQSDARAQADRRRYVEKHWDVKVMAARYVETVRELAANASGPRQQLDEN